MKKLLLLFCLFLLCSQGIAQLLRSFEGHTYGVNSVAFSPDGSKMLSGSVDNTLKLWDTQTGECLQSFVGHTDRVTSVAFSPDGRQVLSGSWDNTLKLWDARTGECLQSFVGHKSTVYSVAFSPDGSKVLSGGWDNTLKLWDARTGKCLRSFVGHTNSVFSVAFSPDGSKVLSGSYDNTLKLWDTRTGECLQSFGGHTSWVYSVAFSPDGSQVLSGSSDKTLKLWDAQTGKCLRSFVGHTSFVSSVTFSPDGGKVLSGSWDTTLKLWDAQTGECLHSFKGHEYSVYSVAFSPDGSQVLSGSYDDTLKLWEVEQTKPKLPANLSVQNVRFTDADGNQTIDAEEVCALVFSLKNIGKGAAQGIKINLQDKANVQGLSLAPSENLNSLGAGASKEYRLAIEGKRALQNGQAILLLQVMERNGFDADPVEIKVNTKAFVAPKPVFADHEFYTEKGGVPEKMELINLKLLVQNQSGRMAKSVKIKLSIPENIFPGDALDYNIGTLEANEAKEIIFPFFANKRYTASSIPVKVVLSESYGQYGGVQTFEVSLSQSLKSGSSISVQSLASHAPTIVEASLRSDVDKNIPTGFAPDDDKFALIIGNEIYDQGGINSEINVPYATADAHAFRNYCIKTLGVPEKNIVFEINASSGKMSNAVEKINRLIKAKDGKAKVLVYYAGHGQPDEKSKVAYLIPTDVNASNLSSAYRLGELYNKLNQYPAQKIEVFIDACFSGGARASGLLAARGVKITPKYDFLQGNIAVLTASSGEQSALAYHEKQHGMFTYFLLKKIQQSKGKCTIGELSDYVSGQVKLESVRVNNREQEPQILVGDVLKEEVFRAWTLE